jgi:hypothetical protein
MKRQNFHVKAIFSDSDSCGPLRGKSIFFYGSDQVAIELWLGYVLDIEIPYTLEFVKEEEVNGAIISPEFDYIDFEDNKASIKKLEEVCNEGTK